MSDLLCKLGTLLDEVTGLVREERLRRKNYHPFGFSWNANNVQPDFYGPRGTEYPVGNRTGGSP